MKNRSSILIAALAMAASGGLSLAGYDAPPKTQDVPRMGRRNNRTKRKVKGQPFGKCRNNPLAIR